MAPPGADLRCLPYLLLVLLTHPSLLDVVAQADVSQLELPPGFSINTWATDTPSARVLAHSGTNNIVYISTNLGGDDGKVYAASYDPANSSVATTVTVLLDELNAPNGIAWHNGSLFVAEIDAVLRYDDVDEAVLNGEQPLSPVLLDTLPQQGRHGWRIVSIGPDNMLYVSIGVECDKCEPEVLDDETGVCSDSIYRIPLDGGEREVVAYGVRNNVGMDWHPVSGDLYFTDNGQDDLGPFTPDDEINVLPLDAPLPLDYGFPECHAAGSGNVVPRPLGSGTPSPDPAFNNGSVDCNDPMLNMQPVQIAGPHVAPLGIHFYRGGINGVPLMFPQRYKNSALVALHGSIPTGRTQIFAGYKVMNMQVDPEAREPTRYEIFLDGFLQRDEPVVMPEEPAELLGRPMDLTTLSDGSLLVSDDSEGAVYRVAYVGEG